MKYCLGIILCCCISTIKAQTTKKSGLDSVQVLHEVVITAQESKGLSSASVIKRRAMDHLQPSSFSDILELLPGGRATDPSLSTPNIISIREVPISSSDYNTSALGTRFMIDGAPISTNANLQFLKGATDNKSTSRSFVNAGVDMRSISTDDIEQVEIIRGIPSVEYGDLTSGLVKVLRRKGGNNISARFKADMDTKLFYLAKGFEWQPKRLSLNLSADYLNSKADPRDLLETYKRITFSARLNKEWLTSNWRTNGSLNVDYSGSFDDDKVDPELNYGGVDKYKQNYNRLAFSASLKFHNKNYHSWLKEAQLLTSISYENNTTERTRLVQLSGETPAVLSKEEGEHQTTLIYPYKYTATHSVDGKPFNLFVKANTTLSVPQRWVSNKLLLGIDFQADKNFGQGQIFDALHPLYPGSDSRTRKYSDIPGSYDFAFYGEEKLGVSIGRNKLDLQAGVRCETLLDLDKGYTMQGKFYLDPRVNLGWTFPTFYVSRKPMTMSIDAGMGWHTKFPTISQLYPDITYIDLVELNYYHPQHDYREIVVQTYKQNPTNYNLTPARNLKFEIRGNVSWAGNNLSVTFFREDMKSGFRQMSVYQPYTFKLYDSSNIDDNSITSAPDYTLLPYTQSVITRAHGEVSNGSRTLKKGIEYTLSTKRFPVINTRITINGAWFKTEYHNSQPVMYKPGVVVAGKEIQEVGIYNDDDGYIREMTNTNFTFDTDIPKLKMGISLSAQCMWFTAKQSMFKESLPISYMDINGDIHPYTDAEHNDILLSHLDRHYNSSAFDRQTVPFSMNLNLKATKKLLQDKLMIALFVNKLWDANPDYKRNGFTIRRYVTPYFGLEMNIKI